MSARTASADARFLAALGGRGFDGKPRGATVAKAALPPPPKLPPGCIDLGTVDGTELPFGIDLAKLLEGRLLIQGASGAGKSWTLRRLLERSAGQIQHVVVDPEGEFGSLAEALGYPCVDAARFAGAMIAELGERIRQHRISLVLDLSNQSREDQLRTVAALFHAMIECPREHWHPALVAVDEAHLFAPFGGSTIAGDLRKASINAVVDLMSRGRKRGLAGILATQRMARLSKSVVSEAHNFLIGINTLDLDVRRAAESIGWSARKAFDRLPALQPGQFVASGSAFTGSPVVAGIGAVQSCHTGAAPALAAPKARKAGDALDLLDVEGLAARSAEAFDDRRLRPGYRAVRQFIRDPDFALAGRCFEALRALMPDGATLGSLALELKVKPDRLAAALALLEQHDVIEIEDRAARISPRFLQAGAA